MEAHTLNCPECGAKLDDGLLHSHVARLMGKKGGKIGGKAKTEKKKRGSRANLRDHARPALETKRRVERLVREYEEEERQEWGLMELESSEDK